MTKISRRKFSFEAAAIAATSFSSARGALGACSGDQEKPGSRAENTVNLDLTADQVREVDARFYNLIKDYGERLSDEQHQRLRRILVYNEKMLASIRAFHVENGDPPASVLKYIEDGSGNR